MLFKNKRTGLLNLFVCAAILLILITAKASRLSAAPFLQSVGGAESWRDPLNLSQSGAASEPRIVVDSSDVWHVIWREEAADSFFYTRKDDGAWREPVAVELPFGTSRNASGLEAGFLYNPQLVADGNGRIHAFWLGDKNALYFSSVLADEFGSFASWSERQPLAASAVDFAAAVDHENNVHLSYVRDLDSEEASAGLYYRKMTGQDLVWGQAAAIYNSAYYRALDGNNANIGIDVVNAPLVGEIDLSNALVITDSALITDVVLGESLSSGRVLVAADNRSTEQVFAFPAVSGGTIWFDPILIDERQFEDSELSAGPSQISVKTVGDKIHLLWLAGHDADCEQYHQWSDDGGLTWQPPLMIESTQNACPEDYRLLAGGDDLLFLLGFRGEEAYLQAWNGTAWSGPEIQPTLTRFVDPVTKRQVSLGCQQTAVTRANDLVVVGCGSSSGAGTVHDVWLLERPLGDETTWFPPEGAVVWRPPELLFDSAEENLASPVLIQGSEGVLHAFWIGANVIDLEDANAKIYYTQWDGASWSRVIPLLPLDTPGADQLQGIMDDNNNVIIAWRNPETGIHYTKQVVEPNIRIPADWSDSAELIEPDRYAGQPDLYVDQQGDVNVVFATPLNEDRGIYWMNIEDSRGLWSEPVLIFDAAEAGWEMVGRPRLMQTENGDFHLIFSRYALQPEIRPESLYYSHSQDGGDTWSEPELIIESRIDWSEIVGFNEDAVLVVWQESDENLNRVLSQQSFDGGQTWERPFTVLTTDASEPARPALTQDETNDQLNLTYGVTEKTGNLVLHDLFWQGGRWQTPEKYTLVSKLQSTDLTGLAGASLPEGELTLLLTLGPNSDESSETRGSLFFTNRQYDFPENTLISKPETEVTPQGEPTVASTPPQPTSTPTLTADNTPIQLDTLPPSTGSSSSLITKIVMGLAPVLLIVGSVITLSWVRLRRNKRNQ